jgi:hypothetical protein
MSSKKDKENGQAKLSVCGAVWHCWVTQWIGRSGTALWCLG